MPCALHFFLALPLPGWSSSPITISCPSCWVIVVQLSEGHLRFGLLPLLFRGATVCATYLRPCCVLVCTHIFHPFPPPVPFFYGCVAGLGSLPRVADGSVQIAATVFGYGVVCPYPSLSSGECLLGIQLADLSCGRRLGDFAQMLYQGTVRILLVVLHDFPEFLCENQLALCNILPTTCLHLRNLIQAALPKELTIPNPFSPRLKVRFGPGCPPRDPLSSPLHIPSPSLVCVFMCVVLVFGVFHFNGVWVSCGTQGEKIAGLLVPPQPQLNLDQHLEHANLKESLTSFLEVGCSDGSGEGASFLDSLVDALRLNRKTMTDHEVFFVLSGSIFAPLVSSESVGEFHGR